jgi:hypothetical protein
MELRQRRWTMRALFLGLCCVLCGGQALSQTARAPSPSIQLSGPTVIAFCEPITDAQQEKDPNLADVLGDFQLYASRARAPLRKLGIGLQEIYARSFAVLAAGRRTEFHPRISVGYYFIAPGRKPRIEYGVRVDSEIVQIAREYFGAPAK